jgi:hypothetical protein
VCAAPLAPGHPPDGEQALDRSAAADALPLEAALLHLDTDFEVHRLSHGPRRMQRSRARRRGEWSSSGPGARSAPTRLAARPREGEPGALAGRRGSGRPSTWVAPAIAAMQVREPSLTTPGWPARRPVARPANTRCLTVTQAQTRIDARSGDPAAKGDVHVAQRERSGAAGNPHRSGNCFVARSALQPGQLLLRGVKS